MKFAFIIATKDRPKDIRSLLSNLASQSIIPDQVIIVDSSDKAQPELQEEFPRLELIYKTFSHPSAAKQRNAGLQYVNKNIDLIGFLDDDIIFEKGAWEKMMAYWESAPLKIGGTAFNLLNPDEEGVSAIKRSKFVSWLGLYEPGIGKVASSGWHTRISMVDKNTQVDWLITGAVLWKSEVFQDYRLDDYFDGYSYLEDLDFSYDVSRTYDLMVVAKAGFYHYHHHKTHNKDWYYTFGRMEVCNRLYFVRKHGLSVGRCYTGLLIRFMQTLLEVVTTRNTKLLARARGNISGLMDQMMNGRRRPATHD